MGLRSLIVPVARPTDIPILKIICEHYDARIAGYAYWRGSNNMLISADGSQICEGLKRYGFDYEFLDDVPHLPDGSIIGAIYEDARPSV